MIKNHNIIMNIYYNAQALVHFLGEHDLRIGLVVGEIQSGKTDSMIATTAVALDLGYLFFWRVLMVEVLGHKTDLLENYAKLSCLFCGKITTSYSFIIILYIELLLWLVEGQTIYVIKLKKDLETALERLPKKFVF